MECSWKTVLLLVCASLGIQYTAIRSYSTTSFQCCPKCSETGVFELLCEDTWNSHGTFQQQTRKHIIIFATTRSGSSFTGQLFNQHPDIFYLFEPLYHVQQAFTNSSAKLKNLLDRRALLGAYRDLLHNLFDCDFYFLENYIKPVPKNHETSSFFRRGASSALCSHPVCDVSQDLHDVEEHVCAKKCKSVNLTLAAKACHNRSHMAIKIVRVPEIQDLRTLLEDPRLNLKIVHLVRDPRAILTSRIGTFTDQFRAWKIWNATRRKPHNVDLSQITTTCRDISNSAETGFSRPSWLKGRYMLVRYEDVAKEPVKKAKEVYNFIGLDWDDKVQRWVLQNTNGSAASIGNYKYTTSRNSTATAESWRLNLSFDIVQTVQALCNSTLSQLGYKLVGSVVELRNISHSLVEPRTFLPFL
uniref:Sulfotransferase n=1 Tax=Latimeria chalumnae TaxID=7897 RepID=H2ZZY1_LATCH